MSAATVHQLRPEAEPYELHGAVVPAADVVALRAYALERKLPRVFLVHLLANNLARAVSTAGEALPHLPAYVSFCYRELPLDSWGSWEAVQAWVNPRSTNPSESQP